VGQIAINFKKPLKPCLVVVVTSGFIEQRLVFPEELTMALETATYIDGLVATNPVATDGLAQADDHMRLIKSTIKATFPSLTGAVTATEAELNVLDGITATTAELNILDGVTATAAELNILDGATITAANLNSLSGITDLASATTISNDTTPSLGGDLQTDGNAILFGTSKWAIELDTGDNDLLFKYNGTTVFKLASNGAVTSADNITAYGTP
jgi:hypothetical protein